MAEPTVPVYLTEPQVGLLHMLLVKAIEMGNWIEDPIYEVAVAYPTQSKLEKAINKFVEKENRPIRK